MVMTNDENIRGTAPWNMLGFISIKRLRSSFTPTPVGPEEKHTHTHTDKSDQISFVRPKKDEFSLYLSGR